jgi:hypothetical protein
MAEAASLKHFLRTRELGGIRLGMREDEVAAILGTPDAVGGTSRKYLKPSLWKYGDVELFFDRQTRRLGLIVINFWGPKVPSGGNAIHLDPWVIRGGLTLSRLIPSLDQEGIEYHETEPINFGTRQLSVGSSVTMIFNDDEEEFPDWLGLCKISAAE